jgi:hypothetical protein
LRCALVYTITYSSSLAFSSFSTKEDRMSESVELYAARVLTRKKVEEMILEAGGVLTGNGHV